MHGADEGILLLNVDDDQIVGWKSALFSLNQLGVMTSDINPKGKTSFLLKLPFFPRLLDLANRDISSYLALFWRVFVSFAQGKSFSAFISRNNVFFQRILIASGDHYINGLEPLLPL